MTPEIKVKIEQINHLLEREEHDSGYAAFVHMRKLWPELIADYARSSELSDDRVSRKEMLEAMREQRINLGGLHDKTLAELKRVREVAAEEINRLEGEVRSLRIDNARLRDEATIRSLVAGSTEGGK